jgi:hypothetical protein
MWCGSHVGEDKVEREEENKKWTFYPFQQLDKVFYQAFFLTSEARAKKKKSSIKEATTGARTLPNGYVGHSHCPLHVLYGLVCVSNVYLRGLGIFHGECASSTKY